MGNIKIPFQFGDKIRHKGPNAKIIYAFVSEVSGTHCVICTFDFKTQKILKKRKISTKTLIDKYELDKTFQILYAKK
jgi:hypothetical protein